MKRVAVYLTLTAVLTLACAVAAQALPGGGLSTVPGTTVSGVQPASAANDIDVPVTITGADFATGEAGAVAPTVTLGGTALTNVTFVDSATLTATVPWGMDPGSYALTVTDPDGGSAVLPAAFTVTQGLGRWNGAALYGGDVRQILMKPGDPNTLYAPAYGLVGLFRSTDAAATWQYTGGSLTLGNNDLVVDPRHPAWLWAYTPAGVERSTDEGATWTTVMAPTWPDGRPISHGQVYPSPSDAQVVFVSSYYEPLESGSSDDARGLIRSSDGGAAWTIVADLADASVVDLAFDPTDASRMALVTQDARVFSSSDAGLTWTHLERRRRSLAAVRSAVGQRLPLRRGTQRRLPLSRRRRHLARDPELPRHQLPVRRRGLHKAVRRRLERPVLLERRRRRVDARGGSLRPPADPRPGRRPDGRPHGRLRRHQRRPGGDRRQPGEHG